MSKRNITTNTVKKMLISEYEKKLKESGNSINISELEYENIEDVLEYVAFALQADSTNTLIQTEDEYFKKGNAIGKNYKIIAKEDY